MARKAPFAGVYAAYLIDEQQPHPREATLNLSNIRTHGNKNAAMEDALDMGGKYVPWPHGKTLAEAIDLYQSERENLRRRKSATPVEAAAPRVVREEGKK